MGNSEGDGGNWEFEGGTEAGEGASVKEIGDGREAEDGAEVANLLSFSLQKPIDHKSDRCSRGALLHP